MFLIDTLAHSCIALRIDTVTRYCASLPAELKCAIKCCLVAAADDASPDSTSAVLLMMMIMTYTHTLLLLALLC